MEISAYCESLKGAILQQYLTKIDKIKVDPYLLSWDELSTNVADFPKVFYPDIVNYLVYQKSAYTSEEMRAYKSLEAYNQAACGWVRKMGVKRYSNYISVLGKVMHSQKLNEKLLNVWIIAKEDGQIVSAHCDCVAGLGECCTHVAAVLFLLDTENRKQEEVTRTSVSAYWMPPSNKPSAPGRVEEIDFIPAKKRLLQDTSSVTSVESKITIPPLSLHERREFLQKLHDTGHSSVAHTIVEPFSKKIHEDLKQKQKFFLTSYYDPCYENKSLEELREIGQLFKMVLTLDECKLIEKETVDQSKSKSWYSYRAGRITASKFKSCCRTSIEKPSLSLVTSICYPLTYQFKSKALNYGCLHEKDAMQDFEKKMRALHTNFSVQKCGFIINSKYTFFGASPDDLSECDCCGINLVEIKCPYCARFVGIEEKLDQKNFFLSMKDGNVTVKEDHAYYYQVQMQLALTKCDKCFLVAWSKNDLAYTTVTLNQEFWDRESQKARDFFSKVLLPEILGKWYTRQISMESEPNVEESDCLNDILGQHINTVNLEEDTEIRQTEASSLESSSEHEEMEPILSGSADERYYCVCQKPNDGATPMIACDSFNCPIEWFHLNCVGLQQIPLGLWYCATCSVDIDIS